MSSNRINFLVHLHEPAREILLCSLDAETLAACCCVCKSWNVIVNSCGEAWKNACRKLGLLFCEDAFTLPSHWKGYALSIVERKIRMRKSTCFSRSTFGIESKDIKAIANWENLIAVAFSDRIQIWRYQATRWVLNYETRFETERLLIHRNYLLAATSEAAIHAWRFDPAEEIGDYRATQRESSLSSFDCLTDYNVVAASYRDCCICVWNFDTGEMVKKIYHRGYNIVKVMLAPRTPEEASAQIQVFLFTVDDDAVCLRVLTYDPSDMTYGNVEDRQISIIPLGPPQQMPETFEFIGSLLFDGQFLYYPESSPRFHGYTIGVWDVYRHEFYKNIEMTDQVKGLLAVGKTYMAIHTKDHNGDREKLCITKRLSKREVAFCYLPRDVQRLGTTFDNQFLILGETSWLDGLDGANDRGLLYSCLVENEGLRTYTWTQRIVKAF